MGAIPAAADAPAMFIVVPDWTGAEGAAGAGAVLGAVEVLAC
jgi:hypothetical protein